MLDVEVDWRLPRQKVVVPLPVQSVGISGDREVGLGDSGAAALMNAASSNSPHKVLSTAIRCAFMFSDCIV